jgi:hypothetical protein
MHNRGAEAGIGQPKKEKWVSKRKTRRNRATKHIAQ